MAAGRRARRAGILLTLALTACGGGAVPPLPDEFRRLEQREAGCIACHDGRTAAILKTDVVATPSAHPALSGLSEHDRALLGL